jgi:ubiquinone/menaquinone biosynthesis C-methylase UbiE
MAGHDSKQAEKEYLRRTGASAWDLHKPFSPPGPSTIDESRHLFQDFAAAMMHLTPHPADRVLDLAAGVCWCTDWLQRLNIRTVSVDISHDMLKIGRSRLPLGSQSPLATGDLESLPFATGSFDKAYCLSAIHHVPDIGRAVAEIARVLKDDGAVLFSEPGVGHSTKPGSVSAMQDFGVLEQDIVAADFMNACAAAGFQDVRIKPLSYMIGDLGLTADQWAAWQRLARSKRPTRALSKMWRAVLELVGARKSSDLFEETFGMSVVRLLHGAMADHPLIVARKRPAAPAAEDEPFRSRVEILAAPAAVAAGARVELDVRVTNTGTLSWPAGAQELSGEPRLGIQLLDRDRRLIDRDFHRHSLTAPLTSGDTATCHVTSPAPREPGTYWLKLDIVVEGVAWLESRGGQVGLHRLRVE